MLGGLLKKIGQGKLTLGKMSALSHTQSPETILQNAETFMRENRPGDALQILTESLSLYSEDARLYAAIARIFMRIYQLPPALNAWKKALQYTDDSHAAYRTEMGLCFYQARNYSEAAIHYQTLFMAFPDKPHFAALELLNMFYDGKNDVVRKRILLIPHSAEKELLQFLLKYIIRQNAAQSLPEILELAKKYPDSYWIQNEALNHTHNAGLFREARVFAERAVALEPNAPRTVQTLTKIKAQLGEWQDVWPQIETLTNFIPQAQKHPALLQWDGKDHPGKHLAIYNNQGFGDVFMCIRWITKLSSLKMKITLLVEKNLYDIISDNYRDHFPDIRPYNYLNEELPPADYYTTFFSLPQFFNVSPDNLVTDAPYLRADPAKIALWHQKMNRQPSEKLVGICWKGNPKHGSDAQRSIHDVAQLKPLQSVKNTRWINLQVPFPENPEHRPPLPLEYYPFADYADTLAVLKNLDAVVTIDSSVCHAAGALGVKTILLNAYEPEWRWLAGEGKTPWYGSVHMLKQKKRPGDWKSVATEVANLLNDASFMKDTGEL